MADTSKPKRVALYARVSTRRQDVEPQLAQLERVAQQRGWEVVVVLTDNGISGRHGRAKRPGLNELMNMATRGEVDMVAVFKLDRLGRSTRDVVTTVEELRDLGVDLFVMDMGGDAVDTSSASGRFFFQVMAAVAELESGIKSERIKAGLEVAKRKGKRLGRERISEETEQRILELRAERKGYRVVAREAGVSPNTVRRVVKERGDPAPNLTWEDARRNINLAKRVGHDARRS